MSSWSRICKAVGGRQCHIREASQVHFLLEEFFVVSCIDIIRIAVLGLPSRSTLPFPFAGLPAHPFHQMERPWTYGLWGDHDREYAENEWSPDKCRQVEFQQFEVSCSWCETSCGGMLYEWPVHDAQWQILGWGLCWECMQHWLDYRACPFRPRLQDRQLAHIHCAFCRHELGQHPRVLNLIALFCWSNQVA